MRVKICGITNLADALVACEAGADALGFNFAEEAKKKNRYISPDEAAHLIKRLPPYIVCVGVCVNPSEDDARRFLEIVDQLQFHGEEPPELVAPFGARSVKVLRLSQDVSPEQMSAYQVRGFLLDAATADMRGGTGHVCDWDAARKVTAQWPNVILAGGLTPENVAHAIRAVQPAGVDTASGVEGTPGKKDHARIREFIRNAKTNVS